MPESIADYIAAAAAAGSSGAQQVVSGSDPTRIQAAAEQLGLSSFPTEVEQWWAAQDGVPQLEMADGYGVFGLGWPMRLDEALAETATLILHFSDPEPPPLTTPLLVAVSDVQSWTVVECAGDDAGSVWLISVDGVVRIFDSLSDLIRAALHVLELGWVYFEADGFMESVPMRWFDDDRERPDRNLVWPDPSTPKAMLQAGYAKPIGPDPR